MAIRSFVVATLAAVFSLVTLGTAPTVTEKQLNEVFNSARVTTIKGVVVNYTKWAEKWPQDWERFSGRYFIGNVASRFTQGDGKGYPLTKAVQEEMREFLSSPARLELAEKLLGPTFLAEINKGGEKAKRTFARGLEEVLPFLDGKISDSRRKALSQATKEWNAIEAKYNREAKKHSDDQDKGRELFKNFWEARYQIPKKYGVDIEELHHYWWVERRRAEGGDTLVKAWAGVVRRTIAKLEAAG